MNKKKIICVHLLNDFSGSPNVLRNAIDILGENYEIELYTNKGEGFLSNLNVKYRYINYRFYKFPLFTIVALLIAQTQLFFKIIVNHYNDNCIVLVNTVYPFSASIAGKILKKKVIYYVHEVRLRNWLMDKLTFKIASICSDYIIYVSQYLRSQVAPRLKTKSTVIYNTVSSTFLSAQEHKKVSDSNRLVFNVILIASNKIFKGTHTMIKLAEEMQSFHNIQFTMMLNGEKKAIEELKNSCKDITNLLILDSSYNINDLYANSNLLLNLSISEDWIETFGLTILEGFFYGIPAIVPDIGGPTEIVDNNKNGFHVNTRDINEIKEKIMLLYDKLDIYKEFSLSAKVKAQKFSLYEYQKQLTQVFKEVHNL
ncbi:glycosyltransferase family 4 protein [Fulvivirga sp. 29W222]|uniref:Glycosyltransferase family 4 protein n=1 Tax=Fulvivirga marina TaxID=2494733 RepID=A0A937G4J4_9BACT|nr:glycosyltransferase family 4 protein [Fulvivirga marina]MBL6449865.1 glycosyltransferase family 4 protein [Fulvivirga marina]